MPRETKEERMAREEAERAVAAVQEKAFRDSILVRMNKIHDTAKTLGLGISITLNNTGPVMRLTDDSAEGIFDETITTTMDEWEFEYIERRVREFKEEAEAKYARLQLAQSIWNSLSQSARDAIKEHFYLLK